MQQMPPETLQQKRSDIARKLVGSPNRSGSFYLELYTLLNKYNILHHNVLDILLEKIPIQHALSWISEYSTFTEILNKCRWDKLSIDPQNLETYLNNPESTLFTEYTYVNSWNESEIKSLNFSENLYSETIWLDILQLYYLDTVLEPSFENSSYTRAIGGQIVRNLKFSSSECFCRYFILETKYHDIIKKIITCIEENGLSFTNPSLQYFPYTRIFFGAPGTGKSYIVDKEYITNKLNINKELHSSHVFRTVFHREYTYAHFFGQYKPITLEHNTNGCWKPIGALPTSNTVQVVYTFSPGPFMKALAKAFSSSKNVILVIEELNRGNAPAIFGELFQLLDRGTDGCSEVSIDISTDAMLWLIDAIQGPSNQSNTLPPIDIHQSKIYLPPNFHILATMNQSAQGVYALDTAFKRRWSFEYLPLETPNNEWEEKWNPLIDINGTKISWQVLRSNINKEIIKTSTDIPEDRLIGPYFLNLDDLLDDNISNAIKYKIIPYLWHDVIPRKRTTVFKDELLSLDAAINDSTLGFRACIFASPEGNK